jgi:hypothetical protein
MPRGSLSMLFARVLVQNIATISIEGGSKYLMGPSSKINLEASHYMSNNILTKNVIYKENKKMERPKPKKQIPCEDKLTKK